MNDRLTFFKRLLAETPPFWRKVQIISLIIVAAVAELNKLDLIPASAFLLITGAGSALAFFSQCAIKDAPILSDAIENPGVLMEHLPEFVEQISTIHDIIAGKPAAKDGKLTIVHKAGDHPDLNTNNKP